MTSENKEILSQLSLGKVTERWVKTTDGKDMLVWVVLPSDFDENKKYPALLFCEGGPQSPVSQFWSYRWNMQIMAANGYVVVAPNRRGLPGFGSEWNEEISGDWTGQCMKDYLSAIDDAATLPFVDKDRLGAVGASFGGFSVYYLAGHHDGRFKCFIAHDGAFNLESMYTDTEEAWFSNWEYDDAFWNKDKTANAKRTYDNSPHHSLTMGHSYTLHPWRDGLPHQCQPRFRSLQCSPPERHSCRTAALPRREPLGFETTERRSLAAHILQLA